jgi:hypothetical protein
MIESFQQGELKLERYALKRIFCWGIMHGYFSHIEAKNPNFIFSDLGQLSNSRVDPKEKKMKFRRKKMKSETLQRLS